MCMSDKIFDILATLEANKYLLESCSLFNSGTGVRSSIFGLPIK